MGMMIFIGGFLFVCVFNAAFINKDFKSEGREARKGRKAQTVEQQDSTKLIITEDNNGKQNELIPAIDFDDDQE